MGGRDRSRWLVPASTANVVDAVTLLGAIPRVHAEGVAPPMPTPRHTPGPSRSSLRVEEQPPPRTPYATCQFTKRPAHLNYPFLAPLGQPAAPEPSLAVLALPGRRLQSDVRCRP